MEVFQSQLVVDNSKAKGEAEMKNTKPYLARTESFEIESPIVSVETVSTDVSIIESLDDKVHLEILGASEEAKEFAKLIIVIVKDRKISVRTEKQQSGFLGLFRGRSLELEIVLRLPKKSELTVRTVSGDVDVEVALISNQINSVSGDLTVLQNPATFCKLKTVSGDISARAFSGCRYSLKSVSGDISVHVAPNLVISVDGSSMSGDLLSEIPLDAREDSSSEKVGSVEIDARTISGDFILARN